MSAAPTEPVVLIWGESEFLVRDAAQEILGAVRPTELDGGEWVPGATGDLATPSLFGERRALLVTRAERLPEAAWLEIAGYAEHPDPEALLVLTLVLGSRAKGPPRALLKALGDRVEVRRAAVERRDLPAWVRGRAGARGIRGASGGADALIQTLGEDPSVLDQAVAQIADAFPDQGLTPETVAAQFRGWGDRYMWELCDAAFGGNLPRAMRTLTGLLEAGEEPLAILGSIAARLRDLIRVAALPARTPAAEAARAAGLRFDWQVKRYRDQAKRYEPGQLQSIHTDVAQSDQAIKQGARGDVVLEMLVGRIAQPDRFPGAITLRRANPA